MAELTWTVPEAAAVIGIGSNQLYSMCRRGEVPHIRFGKQIRIPKASLAEWLVERARLTTAVGQ